MAKQSSKQATALLTLTSSRLTHAPILKLLKQAGAKTPDAPIRTIMDSI